MIAKGYRYKFKDIASLQDAAETLLLSVLAAEGLFGAARVRMDAAVAVDRSICVFVVDASTVVGMAVNAIFTSFITREFGPGSFHVTRVTGLCEVSR